MTHLKQTWIPTPSLGLSQARQPSTVCFYSPGPGDPGTGTCSEMRLGGSTFPPTASLRTGLGVCEDSVLLSVWKAADTTRRGRGEVTQVKETWFPHRPLLQGAWTSCSDPAFCFEEELDKSTSSCQSQLWPHPHGAPALLLLQWGPLFPGHRVT